MLVNGRAKVAARYPENLCRSILKVLRNAKAYRNEEMMVNEVALPNDELHSEIAFNTYMGDYEGMHDDITGEALDLEDVPRDEAKNNANGKFCSARGGLTRTRARK